MNKYEVFVGMTVKIDTSNDLYVIMSIDIDDIFKSPSPFFKVNIHNRDISLNLVKVPTSRNDKPSYMRLFSDSGNFDNIHQYGKSPTLDELVTNGLLIRN